MAKLLFYFLGRDSQASATELWRTDLRLHKNRTVLSGIQMTEYDLSSDGKQVALLDTTG